MTRECAQCHRSFEAARSDASTCSDRCRQARHREGAPHVITDEDRAAIARVEAQCWLPPELAGRAPLTPDQVRAHVLANAERS